MGSRNWPVPIFLFFPHGEFAVHLLVTDWQCALHDVTADCLCGRSKPRSARQPADPVDRLQRRDLFRAVAGRLFIGGGPPFDGDDFIGEGPGLGGGDGALVTCAGEAGRGVVALAPVSADGLPAEPTTAGPGTTFS